ncbi:hypothetical protein ON010_g16616 [Phytophthora cinnamomi]|nr:hypothetical protein ON010_g16616 [Phytophthora cinnamomi]
MKPPTAQYKGTSEAWMTVPVFQQWLKDLDKSMDEAKREILLLLDNATVHIPPEHIGQRGGGVLAPKHDSGDPTDRPRENMIHVMPPFPPEFKGARCLSNQSVQPERSTERQCRQNLSVWVRLQRDAALVVGSSTVAPPAVLAVWSCSRWWMTKGGCACACQTEHLLAVNAAMGPSTCTANTPKQQRIAAIWPADTSKCARTVRCREPSKLGSATVDDSVEDSQSPSILNSSVDLRSQLVSRWLVSPRSRRRLIGREPTRFQLMRQNALRLKRTILSEYDPLVHNSSVRTARAWASNAELPFAGHVRIPQTPALHSSSVLVFRPSAQVSVKLLSSNVFELMVASPSVNLAILAAVGLAASATAHSNMILPLPTWPVSWSTNSPSGLIEGDTYLPVPDGMSYTTDPYDNTEAYWTAFNASNYTSLLEFAKETQVLQTMATFGTATAECGFSLANGTARDLPAKVEWNQLTSSHEGPCEVWCDDVRVFEVPLL